jgi:hypothetical protein
MHLNRKAWFIEGFLRENKVPFSNRKKWGSSRGFHRGFCLYKLQQQHVPCVSVLVGLH